MKRAIDAAMVAGLAILGMPVCALAQEGTPIGVILAVTGPAYLKTTESRDPLKLDPKRDVMRKLYAGQSLRAGPAGRLKLGLSTGMTEIEPSETWFVVQQEAALTAEQLKVAQALRRYGTPGGSRALGSALFSPADGSAVRPAHMVIRWNTPAKGGKVELRLETESGRALWSQKDADAAAGRLDSAAARKALTDYQSGGGQETLILTMTDADANESRVVFSLLSRASARDLDGELAKWDQMGDKLLGAIGRAYEHSRRRLLVESAEEYEAALALAPESQDLIASAIEAHRRTGNYARAAELRSRLTRLSQ